jgi:hypothetical protein
MSRVKKIAIVVIVAAIAIIATRVVLRRTHPYASDHTPEGAYMRIAQSLAEDHVEGVFPYLETEAQWACFSIGDLRRKTLARVDANYPDAEKKKLEASFSGEAHAGDGPGVFAWMARDRGWLTRLRRDLSGVARVEVNGERASVVTARGTRYPFRVRDNGIWGLTIFTADLVAESEHASRDFAVVNAAADDYARAKP